MRIIPMGFTTPNWPDLDSFIQRATDISPIRFFDENKITPGSIYSHIIALELFIGQKVTRLGSAELSLNHISLSFAIECEEADFNLFMDVYSHKVSRINKINRQEIYYLLMTMTLKEWKETTIRHCNRRGDQYLRRIFNDFYELLVKANLGELFEFYEHRNLDDGTFTLEEAL